MARSRFALVLTLFVCGWQGIRVVKFYSYEPPFAKRVGAIRDDELKVGFQIVSFPLPEPVARMSAALVRVISDRC